MVAQINRLRPRLVKPVQKLLAIFLVSAVFAHAVCAESTPSLISDAETEEFLQSLVRPVFQAAGVPYDANKIFILNNPTLNAFVSNGNYLFVHTGTLIQAENANQLSGILAHETGHIAGGHITRQKLQLSKMRTLSVASLLAAGAAAAASGRGDAAMAVVLGSQSGILNSLTAYQLQEERSADESAVRYLTRLGQSTRGLSGFMKKIQQQNRLSGYEESPYFRTHPLSAERVRFFEERDQKSDGSTASHQDTAFEFVKAKLSAFLLPLNRAERLYPDTDKREAADYARAIIAYRQNRLGDALKILDVLVSKHPNNPFFAELKGQFLFESGRLTEARTAYEQARKLRPNAPDILLGRAQTILEQPHTAAELKSVINDLNRLAIARSNASVWLLLARACDENGQKADSMYASARYSVEIGNKDIALRQLSEAEKAQPSKALRLKIDDLKETLKQDKELSEK